jgi:hypothetical protein
MTLTPDERTEWIGAVNKTAEMVELLLDALACHLRQDISPPQGTCSDYASISVVATATRIDYGNGLAASYRVTDETTVTPNSDWWDRAKLPPRPQPIEIRQRERLCTLRKGDRAVTLEKRAVYSVGEELILSVDGHWRRMRVFRPCGPRLGDALANTILLLQARGWHRTDDSARAV